MVISKLAKLTSLTNHNQQNSWPYNKTRGLISRWYLKPELILINLSISDRPASHAIYIIYDPHESRVVTVLIAMAADTCYISYV